MATSMYAVIQTGGKQYKVKPGTVLQVEKIEGEKGSKVEFKEVLFLSSGAFEQSATAPATEASPSKVWLGKPLVNSASVSAEIVGQGRGDKILIAKYRKRTQYRRKMGHRQWYTQLLITGVASGDGQSAELSKADHDQALKTFHSHLREPGEGHTPKTLGSRVRARGGVSDEATPGVAKVQAKTKAAKATRKVATTAHTTAKVAAKPSGRSKKKAKE